MEEEEIPPLDVSEGEFLDRGAYGSVFLLSNSHRFPLAVKQIRFGRSDKATTTKLVREEYNLLKQLSNEHIVKVYDLQTKPDQLLIVMEYMPGGTLRKLILERGRLSEELSLDFICQLLEGVEHMISRHVINRDIKPTNILLNETCTLLKIADFGCGTRLPSQRETTGLSQDRGTMVYRAPETFRDDEVTGKIRYGTKAEIWSCGMVLYEMLVGRYMFECSDARAVFILGNMKRQTDLEYPYFALVSKGTKQLLDALLTVDKHDRPNAQEALEMARDNHTHTNIQRNPVNHQQSNCSTRPSSIAIEGYRFAGNRIAPIEDQSRIRRQELILTPPEREVADERTLEYISIENDSCSRLKGKPKYYSLALCIALAIIFVLVVSSIVYAVVYHRKKHKDCGSIYLFGGYGGRNPNETLRTVQIYSPCNPAGTAILESLNFPIGEERAGHVAGLLANEIVLIAGGSRNGGDYAMQSTWYFNRSATDVPYTMGPDLLEPRYWSAGAMHNDRFYVCGGWRFRNSCEYLENNGSGYHWVEGVPMLLGREVHAMVSLDGYLYVMGGYNTNNNQKWLSQVERFNPATQKWTQVASLHYGRSDLAAATFEGKIIICGGVTSQPQILHCESYDPTLNKWTLIAPNNVLRAFSAMVVVRNNLYILGGVGQTAVERYLKDEDRWETLDWALDIPRQSTTPVGFPDTI